MSEGKIPGKPRPGYPSRQSMVHAAIYMERRRFDFREWSIVARLCDSSKEIRSYILDYVKDALDMWDGLEPTRGRNCHEIAYIAAFHALAEAHPKCESKERAAELRSLPPTPWTKEQYATAWKNYCQRIPAVRVTAGLKEALERETHVVYKVSYTTASGCTITPFSVIENASG